MVSSVEMTVETVLDEVVRTFSYDPTLRTPLLGRTLREVEYSRTFAVLGPCPEQMMVIAERLKRKGLVPEIIFVAKRMNPLAISGHFFVRVASKNYSLDIISKDGELFFKQSPTRIAKNQFHFRYSLSPGDSLERLIPRKLRPLFWGRKAFEKINPRRWKLARNERKNVHRATAFTARMKNRLTR